MEVFHNGSTGEQKVHPLPLYGHHHHDRMAFHMTGGACPSKGGDWAAYPFGDAGGGWPINYEEITPFCDGFLIDVKCWANLIYNWDDPALALGNAGFDGETIIDYAMDGNVYGEYTDPYLINKKVENPHKMVLSTDGKIVHKEPAHNKKVVIPIEYSTKSYVMDFYGVPELGLTKSLKLSDYCPKNCPKQDDTCAKEDHHPTPAPVTTPVPAPVPCPTKPNEDTAVVKPQPAQANQDALAMTYEVAKKMIGLALVLV
jgi:hypothetical protein